jgi:thiomorpholine-carboxylate dehydrogenase
MPVIAGDFMAVKTVTFFPGNSALAGGAALPTHLAMIELLDRATGQPLAVMDGRLITEMRTAAVSAVAAQALAPRATTLGILGSGVQARSHIEALRVTHPALGESGAIRISSRNAAKAGEIAAEMNAVVVPIEEAAACDIVVTVTAATKPVLLGRWLKPDSLVIGVGAVSPLSRELDDEVMTGTLIVESRESAKNESGDVLLSGARVFAEIGEVIAGTASPLPVGRVVFKSVGMGIEDLVGARLVWDALKNA